MRRTALGWMGIGLAAVFLQAAALEASNPDSAPVSAQRAALNRYCVTCHNEKLKTAGLMLHRMDVEKVAEGAP